ncbi:MAG: Fpg/Nei family DNA glycosylase [Actinomycetota bacterium]|jgi:formamidopyrimidine-DNA glycosylase|nr:Fpg/Nei family DNA glycosylase [Actinomycetota bacterium]
MPEVQAHAERLTAAYAGAVFQRLEPLSFTALKTFRPAPEAAAGQQLREVTRRGKHLLLGMGEQAPTFVVHLMQGGRLRPDPKAVRKPRNGLARWRFAEHDPLLLTEAGTEHKAGVWVLDGDPLNQPPLAQLGPDAETIEAEAMASLLQAHPMRLHTFLRDQRILAGLGRRLANEVCHRARLSPFAPTARLGDAGAAAVAAGISQAVEEGLAAERARDDMSSSKDRPGNVHGRTGGACPVCGDAVREVAYRDYTVHYCATCQTGGRVLADNTTSKFLR